MGVSDESKPGQILSIDNSNWAALFVDHRQVIDTPLLENSQHLNRQPIVPHAGWILRQEILDGNRSEFRRGLKMPGEIAVRRHGRDTFFATGAGLIEVTPTRVSILTDLAVQADKIDEAKAEEARQRAEARLKEKLSAEEVATINASLARSLAQLRVKRRQRK